MANVTLHGIRLSLPVVRLDGYDYIIRADTYQRLHAEKIVTDKFTKDGEPDRNVVPTVWHRWKFTLAVPASASYVDVRRIEQGESFNFGDIGTIHTSNAKVYPEDGLEFYDITALGIFSGTYTSYVYMKLDWEGPISNDPGLWQIPIELWGRDA